MVRWGLRLGHFSIKSSSSHISYPNLIWPQLSRWIYAWESKLTLCFLKHTIQWGCAQQSLFHSPPCWKEVSVERNSRQNGKHLICAEIIIQNIYKSVCSNPCISKDAHSVVSTLIYRVNWFKGKSIPVSGKGPRSHVGQFPMKPDYFFGCSTAHFMWKLLFFSSCFGRCAFLIVSPGHKMMPPVHCETFITLWDSGDENPLWLVCDSLCELSSMTMTLFIRHCS